MMADCEANYARICRLLPAVLQPVTDSGVDAVVEESAESKLTIELATAQPASLSIQVRERAAFTTTVDVQVRVESFADIEGGSGCVNMAVRLYHDVNMAEVFACNRKPSRLASYEYPNEQMFQPDEKAQQNRFLGEWLGLCLRHGMADSTAIGDMSGSTAGQANANHENAGASNAALNLARLLPSGNLAAGL